MADVDLFIEPGQKTAVLEMVKQCGYSVTGDPSRRVVTCKRDGCPPVQVCAWTFANPKALISRFDLTACMAAVSGADVVWHDSFLEDAATRTLRIGGPITNATHTLKRVARYIAKGYRVEPGVLTAIAEAIEKKDRAHASPEGSPAPDEPRDLLPKQVQILEPMAGFEPATCCLRNSGEGDQNVPDDAIPVCDVTEYGT